MFVLSILREQSLQNTILYSEILECYRSNRNPISRWRIRVKSCLSKRDNEYDSLQQSQLDTEMEKQKIKIFPIDSTIWLIIWGYL